MNFQLGQLVRFKDEPKSYGIIVKIDNSNWPYHILWMDSDYLKQVAQGANPKMAKTSDSFLLRMDFE